MFFRTNQLVCWRHGAWCVAAAMEPMRSVLLEQAAALLGVSRRTVYNRIREGRLRTVRTRCGSQRVLLASIVELQNRPVRRRLPEARGAGDAWGEG